MDDRSISDPGMPRRRVMEALLWVWIGGVTAAYLHQFAFVLPHLKSLLK
jgi:hypothetical protein